MHREGTLARTSEGTIRLGSEMAYHARVSGVKGLFHSDELPAYGMTREEVELVADRLGVEEEDAFALVADDGERAAAALRRAVDRANAAIDGVPEEIAGYEHIRIFAIQGIKVTFDGDDPLVLFGVVGHRFAVAIGVVDDRSR